MFCLSKDNLTSAAMTRCILFDPPLHLIQSYLGEVQLSSFCSSFSYLYFTFHSIPSSDCLNNFNSSIYETVSHGVNLIVWDYNIGLAVDVRGPTQLQSAQCLPGAGLTLYHVLCCSSLTLVQHRNNHQRNNKKCQHLKSHQRDQL